LRSGQSVLFFVREFQSLLVTAGVVATRRPSLPPTGGVEGRSNLLAEEQTVEPSDGASRQPAGQAVVIGPEPCPSPGRHLRALSYVPEELHDRKGLIYNLRRSHFPCPLVGCDGILC